MHHDEKAQKTLLVFVHLRSLYDDKGQTAERNDYISSQAARGVSTYLELPERAA